MFEGHRVVVCIPSGRYRYLRVLLPYLLAERHANVIDEVRLWINTDVESDLQYFERMERTHPKVKRVIARGTLNKQAYDEDRNHYQYNDSICRFYRDCIEHDCLYIKLDDDICYVHDTFFQNILKAVLMRRSMNYACVGNVFNVPYVTKVQQDRGVLRSDRGISTGDPRCPVACTDGPFAAYIHEQFLALAHEGRLSELAFDSHALTGRQRIGAMAWSGTSFARFGGRVGQQDEVELTTLIPQALKEPLWMAGDALVSHLAFSHQRAHLEDVTDILKRYRTLGTKLNGDVAA